ncbi:MAG: hypothetical protein IMF16_00145, partial [Proteobacteria bacterium]|nr:hypothetical protein [Pseudomonadota bacterium]
MSKRHWASAVVRGKTGERKSEGMAMWRVALVLAIGLSTGCAVGGEARATTYPVSDLETLQRLCAEVANPGDVIEIQPGTYYLDTPRISVLRSGEPGNPIIIRGVVRDGRPPVIDASRVNVKRGIFRTENETHDVVFEDLELRHAWGSRFLDQPTFGTNAGAFYFQGTNLTARRIHTHHNEDGWFATHNADNILIENCEIDHNGTLFEGQHNATHNFYFCAQHQIVRNCYIHHSGEAQNFKSRGMSTIFAYNWVEEDWGYSVEVASGNEGNTLWIGNVVIKRREPGRQRRILGVGDGTGVAGGTLTMINNTIISLVPNDLYLFTEASSTCDVVLINNVFAGPSTRFLERHGSGRITGTNNWFQLGMNVPEGVVNS